MSEMKVEMGRVYRTRDGREVRIYAVDGVRPWPVHGAIKTDGVWRATSWTLDGHTHFNNAMPAYDLVEVRPRIKREVWVNVYPHRMGVPHGNKAYVDTHRGADAIACVRVEIDVEEGARAVSDITIEWLYDEHHCDTCGTSIAMGARVKKDGHLLMEWSPTASCFGGDDWRDSDVYKGILNCLGYTVSETHDD